MDTLVLNRIKRHINLPENAGRWVILFGFLWLSGCVTVAPLTLREQAQQAFQQGDTEKGFTLFEQAMKMDPGSLDLANDYRKEIIKHNQEDRSISFFKGLTAAPNAPDAAYFNLAFAYIDRIPRVGPMGAAFLSKRSIEQFRQVYDRDAENWFANYGMGMNYLHWPDYFKKSGDAVGFFQKCLEIQGKTPKKPHYVLANIRIGDAYVRRGEVDKAYSVWNDGLREFPNQIDLQERVNTDKTKIVDIIRQMYSPKGAIGAINTDISILWAKEVPAERQVELKPLKAENAVAEISKDDMGLFSWFLKNLPYLAEKQGKSQVDMSPLGLGSNALNADLTSLVAHGMIRGFLSQIEGQSVAEVNKQVQQEDGFLRPFYQEGLGMGIAASVNLDDPKTFGAFTTTMSKFDSRYMEFYYVGVGVWFGLESSSNLERVARSVDRLGPTGAAWAYDGLGFAMALFHYKQNPELIKSGEKLAAAAQPSFYHGVGRAFWILSGDDLNSFAHKLAMVPEAHWKEAHSGYGLGVAMTKATDPGFVFSYLNKADDHLLDKDEFLTGVIMGYTLRADTDPAFVKAIVQKASGADQCRLNTVLGVGKQALSKAKPKGGDLHESWRLDVLRQVKGGTGKSVVNGCSAKSASFAGERIASMSTKQGARSEHPVQIRILN